MKSLTPLQHKLSKKSNCGFIQNSLQNLNMQLEIPSYLGYDPKCFNV